MNLLTFIAEKPYLWYHLWFYKMFIFCKENLSPVSFTVKIILTWCGAVQHCVLQGQMIAQIHFQPGRNWSTQKILYCTSKLMIISPLLLYFFCWNFMVLFQQYLYWIWMRICIIVIFPENIYVLVMSCIVMQLLVLPEICTSAEKYFNVQVQRICWDTVHMFG